MKISDIFITANGNLARSKLRSILTIIAIFIGALTLTLTNGIGAGVSAYIDEQLGNVGANDMFVIQAKENDPFGESSGPKKYQEDEATGNLGRLPVTMLNQSDLEKIRSTPGIISAELEKNTAPSFIRGPNNERLRLTTSNYFDGVNISLKAGNAPNNHIEQNQIVLTPDYPTALGFQTAGDSIGQTVVIGIKTPTGEMEQVNATVVGVQEQTLMNMGGLLINRSLNKSLFAIQTRGLPPKAIESQPIATARFDTKLNEKQIQELKKTLADKGYNAATIMDRIGNIKQVIDAIIMIMNFFAGIALLAASFGIVNTLLMAIQERTKEIGLMKAMGMSSRKIFMLFSTEAMLLGFWGSLVGVLAGIGIGRIANQIASRTFLKDLVGFQLTSFPVLSIISIVIIVMFIAFLAGTLPARKASKKDPIESLRYE